jgi:hypothetical protein
MLDEVRRRYGIQDSQAHPTEDKPSGVPMQATKQQPQPTVSPQPSASKTSSVPFERVRSEPKLEFGEALHQDNPARCGSPSDNQNFHYLIQIAECAVALYCEVTADCESSARQHIEEIPNLLECRKISGAELAEIMENEKAPSKKTKKVRFSARDAAAFRPTV